MYSCVADKAFLSSTTISTLALHTYLSRHSLLPSILLFESSGVLSSGVGAFGMIRKPESYHIVSRYQVATPSRAITTRATGLLHIAALHPNAHRLSCHKTMVYNAASFDKLFQDSQKFLRGGPL